MACKQEFWAVLNVKTLGISTGFSVESLANSAAKRYAIENPGHEFAVLRSVRSFVTETPQPTEYEHGDYPF